MARVVADPVGVGRQRVGGEGFLQHWEAHNQGSRVALRLTASVQRAIRGISQWQPWDWGLEVAEVTVALST